MRILLFVLGLAAAIGLLSCQKEISREPGGNEPAPSTKLLTKYVYSASGFSGIAGRAFIDSFLYDSQNRCIRINSEYIDSNWLGSTPYILFTEFHYKGSDNLPFKLTDTSEGRDLNWYLFYDALNRPVKDSVIFLRDNNGWITHYNYNGNRVIATSVFNDNFVGTFTTKDTLESDGSNWIKYSFRNLTSLFNYQVKATYDTHPNAFSTVNVSKAFLFGISMSPEFTQSSKNSPLTTQYFSDYNPIPTYTSVYTYVYDADGYPVSSIFKDPADPTRNGWEKFTYNK